MKKRFSDEQIISILREAEAGVSARKHAISDAPFYTWRGTAAELANCGYLAVFPGQGWWKTRRALECYDSVARYSLVVSIHAPGTDIDLLTPVRIQADALITNSIDITS